MEPQHSPIYLKLAESFPELIEDNARVQCGEKPQSAIFRRTAQMFDATLKLDPSLKESLGAVYLCALMSKEELTEEQPQRPKASLVDHAIAREFPGLVLDKELVARGRQPQSPLYALAMRVLNEACKLDPALRERDGAVLLCARIARLQLEVDGKKLAEAIQ